MTVLAVLLSLFQTSLLLLTTLWLIPTLVLAWECVSAAWPGEDPSSDLGEIPFKILIPAHNEAAVIAQTVTGLLAQVDHPDRLMVIADNCTDDTADIARSFGVTVLERTDPNNRGKGFALDFGRQALQANPPDIVILMDADCDSDPGTIGALIHRAHRYQRPIQALYLMEQPPHSTPKSAISALAFLVKNQVRPLGLARWGWPCLLMGTGIALPWSILATAPLASENLVEDIQLGLDLAIAGHPPQFCPQAKVIGRLPQQETAATSQRTRWEHGYLQTLLRQVPRLLQESWQQKRWDLLLLAADISIVPLSLWVLLWLGLGSISVIGWQLGLFPLPLALWLLAGILFTLAVGSAWGKFGQQTIPARNLWAIPLYVLWKIPLYFAFLVNRQSQWVRTERDGELGR